MEKIVAGLMGQREPPAPRRLDRVIVSDRPAPTRGPDWEEAAFEAGNVVAGDLQDRVLRVALPGYLVEQFLDIDREALRLRERQV